MSARRRRTAPNVSPLDADRARQAAALQAEADATAQDLQETEEYLARVQAEVLARIQDLRTRRDLLAALLATATAGA